MQHDELIWSNIGNKVKEKKAFFGFIFFFRTFALSKRRQELKELQSSAEMNTI